MLDKKNIIYSCIYILLSVAAIFILINTKVSPSKSYSATIPQQEFVKAKVEKIEQGDKQSYGTEQIVFQLVSVKILEGNDNGTIQKIQYDPQHVQENVLKVGDAVVLATQMDPTNKAKYYITDRYRIPNMIFILAGFFLFVFFIAGWKGFGSIFGLIVSITVVYSYVLPNILAGQDPLTICFHGALAIILVSTYAAHGFSRQTTVALVSTLAALFLTYFIAKFVVSFSLLSGFGSDAAYDLHFGQQQLINMRGLLLGGVMIATVGALNDVTTTQAAAVFHLVKANHTLNFKELFTRGFSIGREHVISLVNTLILAYVGSSLALFIIFFYNPLNQPYWIMLNSEIISEEVIKTLAGTFGLILSMPIVTFLSAVASNKEVKRNVKSIFKELFT